MTRRIPWNERRTATDLELIALFGRALTRRQREILTVMAAHPVDDEGELVYEHGIAYLGNTRVAAQSVTALLRACAIRAESSPSGVVERYRINETGRSLLRERRGAGGSSQVSKGTR